MELVDIRLGKIKRTSEYLERYEEAVCGHNCLRIRRILTSLTNLGFRRYAVNLEKFLYQEIYENDRPLKYRDYDYKSDWKAYGEFKTANELKKIEKFVS